MVMVEKIKKPADIQFVYINKAFYIGGKLRIPKNFCPKYKLTESFK